MNLKFPHYISLLAIVFVIACQAPQPEPNSSYHLKHEPYDLASLQRSFPNRIFDERAYKKAISQAISLHQSRSTSPDGFEADWTVQGPGNAGARINTIEIDPANDSIVYLGYSGGGVWKTTDNGTNWNPIFDDSPYLAIGSIEVDPSNSDIVYVGTGDPNITGYPYIGNGVYKSIDAGVTWTSIGLQNMGIVSKVLVDPTNNQTVYASCMGSPFVKNNDRGLFKSTDGGENWIQVLLISDQAGVIDFLLDPVNTNRLYACGWDRIRSADQSFASGNGGRIFRSLNAGNSWTMMTNGLPTNTTLSRSSLSMSASNPNIIYASIIDSTFRVKGIYKTTNGGDSWITVTDGESNGLSNPVSNFGWYFGRIFVHPNNDNHIFLCGVRLWNSQTSGSGWNLAAPSSGPNAPHVDNHFMAFDSAGDTYVATDGGLYRRDNGGTIWADIEDIPATQLYRVAYNPHEIDTYYGGAQDNGTQAGHQGIIDDWDRVFGADGFQPVFHPTDDQNFFVETQRGDIWVTFDSSGFQVATFGIDPADRVHWDMQYIMSSHNPDVMYAGTYRMYKAASGGNPAWVLVSGDLTDGTAPGVPSPTISTVAESPVDSMAVYCGTTDANVWRSLNAGNTWTEITTGLPQRYVTCIKGHPNVAGGVYVAHSGYLSDENTPHLHYSSDYGDTWTDISGDLPDLAVNHIEVMPNNYGNVIFVATDGGVYATLNGGQNWNRLGGNLPYIITYDLDLNLAKNELIAGTFGRSIQTFPLDSIGVSLNPPAAVDVAGHITTPLGLDVNLVDMDIDYGSNQNMQSDTFGLFAFNNIPTGNTTTVTPHKNTDADNGVTTFDLLLIKKHILNIDTLDSPYKIIAADVNKSTTISSFDIILLTKIVLVIDTAFTTNESWRFIQSDHVFPNPHDPFTPAFLESYVYNPLSSDQPNSNFIGIKIGDVTNNANPGLFSGAEDRSYVGEFPLNIQDQYFKKGDQLEVAFQSNEFNQMLGYQFTIGFDQSVLAYQGASKATLKETGTQDFGESFVSQGIITTNWSDTSPTDLTAEDSLFIISFIAKRDGKLSDYIILDPGYTQKEAYQHEADFLDVTLQFSPIKDSPDNTNPSSFELYQNNPNPFSKDNTTIQFYLPESQEASIKITSLTGELIYQTTEHYPKGKSQIIIPSNLFPSKGIYLYQLSTENNQKTKKMLKL